MTKTRGTTPEVCTGRLVIRLAILLVCVWPIFVHAEEAKPAQTAKPSKNETKKVKKELTGAELYAIHCNRCHPERYAPERTDVQWKTILTHMRVRANLPAKQAQAILKFLQEDSGK